MDTSDDATPAGQVLLHVDLVVSLDPQGRPTGSAAVSATGATASFTGWLDLMSVLTQFLDSIGT